MTLDCDKYRINVKLIQQLILSKSDDEIFEMLSILAIVTEVPIIIVCYYIMELNGFNSRLSAQVERFKEFYAVNDIINMKEKI